MLEKILFRAISENRYQIVYGYLLKKEDEYYIIDENDISVHHKVYPKTICIFTGISSKDKTQRIFSRDIIAFKIPEDKEAGFYRSNAGKFAVEQNIAEFIIYIDECRNRLDFVVTVRYKKFDGKLLTNGEITPGQEGFFVSIADGLMFVEYVSGHCDFVKIGHNMEVEQTKSYEERINEQVSEWLKK